jgi:hypothetical protein
LGQARAQTQRNAKLAPMCWIIASLDPTYDRRCPRTSNLAALSLSPKSE